MSKFLKSVLIFLISMVFVVCPCFASQSIDKVPVEFITGTEVSAEDGLKPIEEIQVGDKVWAYNEQTGETNLREVVRLYENRAYNLVEVMVNGEVITSTDTHPYFVQGKGWIKADELEAGDILIDINGKKVIVESTYAYTSEEPVTVYNFEVQESHTYFVGEQQVLVHNRCGGKKTLDELTEGLTDTTTSKGSTRNLESSGGFEQTLKDFDSLGPNNVKDIVTDYGTGKVGYLENGSTVVARPGSKTGGATLEITISKNHKIKIRY